jgi:hypothetical protein
MPSPYNMLGRMTQLGGEERGVGPDNTENDSCVIWRLSHTPDVSWDQAATASRACGDVARNPRQSAETINWAAGTRPESVMPVLNPDAVCPGHRLPRNLYDLPGRAERR